MDIVGIDIAKATLEVLLLKADDSQQAAEFANNESGLKKLQQWLKKQGVSQAHVCMEATNIYWEEPAEFLVEQGYQVSVVNPARIKGFALSQLRRTKTDKLDSQVIAQFCQKLKPALWTPPTPTQRKLRALVRHRRALHKTLTQQKNRLASCRDTEIIASLQMLIDTLQTEINRIEQQTQALIEANPDLQERQELLNSIQGIGQRTATDLIAELYDLDHYTNAPAVAADAGLTPAQHSSGTSVNWQPKLSKVGKASVRAILYWPAISAMRYNPIVKDFTDRLLARGKHKKVVIVAAMRKLLHLAYGVVKHRQPFDPNYRHSPPLPT